MPPGDTPHRPTPGTRAGKKPCAGTRAAAAARCIFLDAETASAEYADCQTDPQGRWEDATVEETGQWGLETEATSRYIAGLAYVYGTSDTTASSYEVQWERLFLSRVATVRPWAAAETPQ